MKSGILAALLLMFALPAAAQNRGAGAAPVAPAYSGGGGGFGGGLGSSSFSSPSFSPTVHYQIVYAHGSDATFVPTRFVSYCEALKLGKAALAYRPKTIAEVAAEYRAAKLKTSSNSSNQPPKH
jgi:hypothetical protein